ncbi:Mediator of RNA polymerase II transcription [Salix suchowensis]|nr:Mediator of RNA polymerase II transcription [Salix suchowensis]
MVVDEEDEEKSLFFGRQLELRLFPVTPYLGMAHTEFRLSSSSSASVARMATKPSASSTQNSAASFQQPPVHPGTGEANHSGRNGDATLLDSLLANVKVGRHSVIHIFAIVPPDRLPEMLATLRDLKFEGLDSSGPLTFTPQDVYLASHASRSSSGSYTVNILDSSPSSIPRKTLQNIYCQFIAAIRNRLIDDIVRESVTGSPRLLRLQDGVLLDRQNKPSEWGAEWEHHAQTRALILCTFRILLLPSPARFVIHPLLSLTSSLPLGTQLPLPPGTPITLLPSGTPAYYLSTYTGPTSGLMTQFNESLVVKVSLVGIRIS